MKKIYLFIASILFLPSLVLGAVFNHNLSIGTTGTDVSSLQQFLNDVGLYNGPITGTFGSITKNALVAFQNQEGITPSGYFGVITRADANKILEAHTDWVTNLSNGNYYKNVNGNAVHSPSYSSNGIPAGATAQCRDGTYSYL